jgi:hypothetical protein
MAGSPLDARLLDGLSLAQAFEIFVLKDPDVTSSASSVLQHDRAHESVFREGQYPGPYVEYVWPLDVAGSDLAFQFVRSGAFCTTAATPVVPRVILDISEILAARIREFRELLTSGRVIAHGTFAKAGSTSEVDRLQWARRKLLIDVKNSDLVEIGSDSPIVKWTGLTLHLPTTTKPEEQEVAAKPNSSKLTAHRASIIAAIDSIWPQGISAGLTVQVRNGMINDWQRKNGRVVTSGKTIGRHLSLK